MNASDLNEWRLDRRMDHYYRRWLNGQRWWSFVHHGSLFGAAALSVVVGILVAQSQAGGLTSPFWVSMSSFGAGLLTTLAGLGGFKAKWQANRNHRGELEALRMEWASRIEVHVDEAGLQQRFIALVKRHDRAILAAEDAAPDPKPLQD